MSIELLRSMSDTTLTRRRLKMPVALMAKWYGVSTMAVYSELKKRGIQAASNDAKLTVTKVRTIRLRIAAGESMASLGREYGVCLCTIRDARDFITWKWVR